jgi:glycerol-3-phosphate acyltransferase PlsY
MLMLPFIFPGYLFGSVPFGLLLTRLAGLGDIRAIGSGNIGATNVLRTGH